MTIIGVKITLTEAEEVLREAPERMGIGHCLLLLSEGLGKEVDRQKREIRRLSVAQTRIEDLIDDLQEAGG